jgi:hypothetical protein
MTNELEMIWKEVLMVSFKVLSQYLAGGTKVNHENPVILACLQAKI